MATASSPSDNLRNNTCKLCLEKLNRFRPSFCQCQHCAWPLCVECMNEHHDELLQSAAEISHQYNEIKALLHSKQKMVVDMTEQSIVDVNRYFDSYISELRETQRKILFDMEEAKQDAQERLSKIDHFLKMIARDIEALNKANALRPANFDDIPENLKKLEQQLEMIQMNRIEQMPRTQPKFSLDFNSSLLAMEFSLAVIIKALQNSLSSGTNKSLIIASEFNPSTIHKPIQIQLTSRTIQTENDESSSGIHIYTTYVVNRLASDGENVMYASYAEDGRDIVAYCTISRRNQSDDPCREWRGARIEDMIWWSTIEKFLCASRTHVRTIDHSQRKFHIQSVLRGQWSSVLMTTNRTNFFLHTKTPISNELTIYTSNFEIVKIVDFKNHKHLSKSLGSCAYDQGFVSLSVQTRTQPPVLQLKFFDFHWENISSKDLGAWFGSTEIRTDDNGLFFIIDGKKKLHIVSTTSRNKLCTIMLAKECDHIAVLNNRRLAVSKNRSSFQIIKY